MKIKYLLIAVLAGAALVGCNRTNDLDVANDGVNRYVAFQIVTPAVTKGSEPGSTPADNYTATLAESELANIRFIFYRNGAYLTTGKTTVVPGDFGFPNAVTDGASVERKSTKLVVVLESTGAYPTHVLCLANFSATDFDLINKKSLAEARKVINSFGAGSGAHRHFVYEEGSKQYFMMTNSSYIDASGKVVDAYEVMEDYIFKSEAEAIASTNDKVINLYIDRLASKVNVTNSVSSQDLTSYGPSTIGVSLKSWGLNAVNRKGYFIKSLDKTWTAATYPWMHIGRTGDEARRISWAQDPNYTTAEFELSTYPNDAEHYEKNVTDANLFYYSLNDILANDYKKLDNHTIEADGTFVEYSLDRDIEKRFCLENTFDETLAKNFRRVGTHVLVIAQATFGGAIKDFYKYNGICYDLDGYKAVALGPNGFQQEYKFYTKVAADTYEQIKPEDIEIYKAVVKEKTATEPAKIVKPVDKGYSYNHSDGFVSLFLTTAAEGKTWYYADASKTTVTDADVTEDTGAAKLKDALATKLIERADAFKDGMMYYCVPLEHYNPYVSADPKLGMHGMVRNHFYDVTTGAINTLGKGIYDPTEIIVPGDKAQMWYLAAKININAWHIVKQTTDLEE